MKTMGGENERLCAVEIYLRLGRFVPSGDEPGTCRLPGQR